MKRFEENLENDRLAKSDNYEQIGMDIVDSDRGTLCRNFFLVVH